jgi:long-chain fatty acid transport protein
MHKPFNGMSSYRIFAAAVLTACTSNSLAAGFALLEQSASQQGNSFAGGAAIANDASTIFYNPAGMTRLPTQLVGGLHLIIPRADFSGTATDPLGNPVSGGNGSDAGREGIVPNLYFSMPVADDLFIGLGINAPFGLRTKYDSDWKGRYQAIESDLKTININPSVAYKVNDLVSVGFGFSLQYMDVKLTQKVDQGSLCIPTLMQPPPAGAGLDPAAAATACAGQGLTPQNNDARARVDGDNWAGGWNTGLLLQPSKSTRVGLQYRSQVKQRAKGKARFQNTAPLFANNNVFVRTNASAKVDFPASASLSVYQDVNDKWSVMGDVTWTEWSNFDQLKIEYDSFQPDTVIDESWDDTMRYALGVDYRFNSTWTFRAGGSYEETPIPNARHRTPRIPGETRKWASVGFGYQATPAIRLDVGYSHLFVDDPDINSGTDTTGNLKGEYDAKVDIISAQIVWNI